MNTFIASRLYNNTKEHHARVVSMLKKNALLNHAPFDMNGTLPYFEVVRDTINIRVGAEIIGCVCNENLQLDAKAGLTPDDVDAMLHEVYHGRPAIAPMAMADMTKLFNEMWEKFEKKGYRKPFNPSWNNGTGYFRLSELPTDRAYDVFNFIDDKDRKGLVLWDCLSNSRIVIFERYTNSGKIAYNHTFGCAEGVSGSGAVHVTPYIIGRMMDINRYSSLNS